MVKSVARTDVSVFYTTKFKELDEFMSKRVANIGGGWGNRIK